MIMQVATTPAPATTTPAPDTAEKCDEENCSLPWCFCSRVRCSEYCQPSQDITNIQDGTKIPGGLELEDTPQMVLIMIGESLCG